MILELKKQLCDTHPCKLNSNNPREKQEAWLGSYLRLKKQNKVFLDVRNGQKIIETSNVDFYANLVGYA